MECNPINFENIYNSFKIHYHQINLINNALKKGKAMKPFNVCIVGGGSTYTLGFLKSFVRLKEEFPLKKLVLFDIDKDRQEPIGKYGEILFKERLDRKSTRLNSSH